MLATKHPRTELPKTTTGPESQWPNYIPIALVAIFGLTVTWLLFRTVAGWERQRVQIAFQAAASDRVLVIQREFAYTLGVVQDIGSFIDASPSIGRREFRKYVGPALKRFGSIETLEWIPRIVEEQRTAFEEEARRSLSRFQIKERDPEGNLVPAAKRAVHFPVLYVQPYQLKKEVLGLDLASDSAVLQTLLETRDLGKMLVSSPIPLKRKGVDEFGFAVQLPVFNKEQAGDHDDDEDIIVDTVERQPHMLRGFARGIFRIGDIVERALDNLSPSGIELIIYNISAESGRQYLYYHASRKHAGDVGSRNPAGEEMHGKWEFTQPLNVANRQWVAGCRPARGYFRPDPWSGWSILVGGWSFTALLTVYLATLMGSTAKVRRLVRERTAQLTDVNEELNREVGERMYAETELKALNETLEQRVARRTAEANRRAEELEQFAYVTSHDLKAPLRGIANLAGWLQEDLKEKLTEATREQLELLRDRVKRMNALIEGLLDYSRIGRTAQSVESVDVTELLVEIADSLSPQQEFSVDIAPDMPTLITDRLQLYQVFANLISNSIKHHGGKQGHVWIKVSDKGDFYQFTVKDDGPGIAPEYHDKVFMMFQTLETKDYGTDTGIGLALVRKIVQEHGGSIKLKSEKGEGARFRFTWPKTA
jgi:signal transduction histidine kinase/sensor domain CHASE-containing protein